jgi:hypothetical protein
VQYEFVPHFENDKVNFDFNFLGYKMLKRVTKGIIIRLIRLAFTFRFCPYTWDPATKTFPIPLVRTRLLPWLNIYMDFLGFKLMTSLVIGNSIFGALRTIYSIYFMELGSQKILLECLLWILTFFNVTLQVNQYLNRHAMAELLEEFFKLEDYWTSNDNIAVCSCRTQY